MMSTSFSNVASLVGGASTQHDFPCLTVKEDLSLHVAVSLENLEIGRRSKKAGVQYLIDQRTIGTGVNTVDPCKY